MGFPREAALSRFWAMTSPAATQRCFDLEGEAGGKTPSAFTTTTIAACFTLWATMQINCKQCREREERERAWEGDESRHRNKTLNGKQKGQRKLESSWGFF